MNASTNTLLVSSLVASGLAVVATNAYAATDSAAQQGIVTTLHLNVRSSPSTTSTILGTLVQGQSVSIVNQNNGWAKISFNGKDAYISLDYIRLASPAATNAPAQTQAATVNADKLNVRSSSSTSSSILGSLIQGQSVSVLSSSNGWAKISFNGKDAFVSLAFLKLADSSASSSPAPSSTPAPAQTQAATVNADKLNVRSSASTSSSILGSLVQGQSVSVLSSSNGWAKISFNGKDAFVSLAFLKLADSSASSPAPSTPAPTPAQTQAATVNADKLNVRSSSSTSSSILGSLVQGQSVSVLSSSNGWAKISFNGKDAFVSLAFLKLADSSASSSPAPSAPAPAPAQTQAATVNADKLNVRSSASTSSSIVGSLIQGQSVSVLSSSNGWAKISFNGKDAFVSLAFLKLVDSSANSPAPSTPAPAPAQTQTATVNADKLNVRSSSSTSSSILGSLVQGQSVSVLSSSNGWAKISFNGKDAFVSLAFLKLADSSASSPAPSTPVPAPAPVQTQAATVNADKLNVRSSSSTSSSILGSLVQGQSVSVLSSSNGWAKISFNGKDAFVSLAFLKLADSSANSPAPSTPAPAPAQTQAATVNADKLNVRSSSSTSSSILGSLVQGQSVSVLSSSNGWAKISFNGKDAFVSLAFLKLVDSSASSPAPSTPAPTPAQTQAATVNADKLNVRSSASTSSSILGSLVQGQSVSVLSSSNGWAKISFNGKDAFVSLAFLKLVDSSASSPAPSTPAPAPAQTQTATVNADKLNVRSDASTSSSIVGSLIQGQSVSVLSSSNGWAKISFNGKDAFVSLAFLKIADSSASSSPAPSAPAPAPAQTQAATVNADKLNVRSSASTSSSILGSLVQGQSVSVLSSSNGWAKISFNGKDAFVSLAFLKLADTSTTPSTPTSTGGSNPAVISAATITVPQIDVRESASYSSTSLGTVSKGSSIGIIEQSGDWIKISFNNKEGYIPALSIKPLVQEQTTTVTASILNVRDTPSINGNIIGKLNKGQTVQTISSENGWAKIQYNGSYAYVSTGYLNQSTTDVSYSVVTSNSTILQDNQTNAETLLSTTQEDSYISRNGQVIDMKNGFVRTNGVVNIYDRVTNQKLTYVAANTDLKFEKAVGSLIYVTLDGMKGYVTLQDVTLFPGMLHSPTSYYTVNNSNLVYNLYDASSSNYYSYSVGYAPTQLTQGVQYEAFDRTSIGGQDSYQYFQYVPLRISANYSADELNQFIKANRPDSPLVGTGQYFIDAANKYHINVSYLLAHAIIESGWGTSSIAKDKNNLFGFQAVDYNPYGGAASFSTLQQGIDYCAQYIDKNYLTPNSLFYNGDFLGDKARGMNVYYASDSNWSNEIASVMHKIDVMYGDRNLHSYQLGKISTGVQLVQNLAGQKAYLTNHEIIAAIKNTIQTPAGTMYELVSDDPQYSSVYVNASDITLIKSY